MLGFWAGALAGVLAALGDFALGLPRVGQFLPGPMGKCTFGLFLVGLYGLFGSLLGLGFALLGRFLDRASDLGMLVRAAWAKFEAHREEDLRTGLRLVAWAAVAPAVLLGAALLIFALGLQAILQFHHKGLIVALIAVISVGVTLASIVVAFPLQRGLFLILRLVAIGKAASLLGSPGAAVVAAAVVAGVPISVIAALTWETTRLLPFRPFVIAGIFLGGLVLFWYAGWKAVVQGRISFLRRPILRFGGALFLLAVLLAVTIAAGRFEQVRKAASSYAAFGTPLTVALRFTLDLDRDGSAAILGGGDCNDLDPDTNPKAFDWPDDGIDQNCNGQDATVKRPKPPPFHPVPDSVPRDLNVLLVTIDT
ncbi:MAG: putative metal-binding motif-containing protein, partial [Deltaproteobacteria bacterium]|nr:putative metal-binding motif-containing protein [Deltaproteobacteria bacterium]